MDYIYNKEYTYSPFHPIPYLPLGSIVVYLLIIGVLHRFMRNRKPFELTFLLGLHNLFLCLWSLLMFSGLIYRVFSVVRGFGVYAAYCGTTFREEDEKLVFWAQMFYLSKYYELLDTVFVVLRKKQLTFLHVWHHCAVVFVCWLAVRDEISMGWITVFDNTGVHVLMYYYYAIQSLERRDVWWKKYLTTIQIIQFCIDIVTSVPFLYLYVNKVKCAGSFESWLIANLTGFSFFLLFVNFYIQQYKSKKNIKSQTPDKNQTQEVKNQTQNKKIQ